MKVAYQGVPGAYSHEACLRYLPDHEAIGRPTFGTVLDSVTYGEAEFGMLPVENSVAGPVSEVQELLAAGSVRIVEYHSLPVRIHLLGLPGSDLSRITTAVSHPMALKQCSATLASLGLSAQEASNTAAAAQSLADPSRAVLASEAAAEAYGLTILRRDVHDRADNATTFCVVARQG